MRNCLQMLSCKQDVKEGGAGSALGYKQAELWDGSWLELLLAPVTPTSRPGLASMGPWQVWAQGQGWVSTRGLDFNKEKQ